MTENTQAQMINNNKKAMVTDENVNSAASYSQSFFIHRTIRVAELNIEDGGRPFACLIVDPATNTILSQTGNHVAQTYDPTAHAEVLGIRLAAEALKQQRNDITAKALFDLDFYIMASPCPMCFGAMYLCAPRSITFITTRESYSIFYSDPRKYITFNEFYGEFIKDFSQRRLPTKQFFEQKLQNEAIQIIKLWREIKDKNGISTVMTTDRDTSSKDVILDNNSDDDSLPYRWFYRVLDLARANVVLHGGRPFACVVARGDELIAESADQVDQLCDPTAHAEMQAIRIASQKLGSEHMYDMQIYSLAMPSPMSIGAMYYCSPSQLTFLVHPSLYEPLYQEPAAPKVPKLCNLYLEYGLSNDDRIMKMNQIEDEQAREKGLEVYRRWFEINIKKSKETSAN
jgi:tRNA(Arg) A34 adenosine deaminase TadA